MAIPTFAERILEKKERPSLNELSFHRLNDLKFLWENLTLDDRYYFSDFFYIRAITLLEVTYKGCVQRLVDGHPDIRRRIGKILSKIPQKELADSLLHVDEEVFTVGDLVALMVKCSKIEDIMSTMDDLFDGSFKAKLEKTTENWTEDSGTERKLIIVDPVSTYENVARSFMLRHIIVHESPVRKPYETNDVETMLEHISAFSQAISWLSTTTLYGAVPRTQQMMNTMSWQRYDESCQNLYSLLSDEPIVSECLEDYDQHHVWHRFCQIMAEARSGFGRPFSGSIAPTLYGSEAARLNKWRFEDVQRYGMTRP